jgi:hypothetical protein
VATLESRHVLWEKNTDLLRKLILEWPDLGAGAEAERGEALDDYNEAIARVAALRRGGRGCAALDGGVRGGVRAARGTRGGDSLSLCAACLCVQLVFVCQCCKGRAGLDLAGLRVGRELSVGGAARC